MFFYKKPRRIATEHALCASCVVSSTLFQSHLATTHTCTLHPFFKAAVMRTFVPEFDIKYVWHLVTSSEWMAARDERDTPYFPPTFDSDGFVHLASLYHQLLDVGNHFYKASQEEFLALKIDVKKYESGMIKYEPPAAVGNESAHTNGPLFPHLYNSGLLPSSVVSEHKVVRDARGAFVAIENAELPFDGIVFDCDGTLIDSEFLWHEAEIEVYNKIGMPFEESDCRLTTGLAINEAVAFWRKERGWESSISSNDVTKMIIDRVCELIAERGTAKRGVHEAIEFARKLVGGKLAIASSSPKNIIMASLKAINVDDGLFGAICSAEDEPFGKPNPAVYLTACKNIGVKPARALAVEDSKNGMDSALRAGMRCIAIPEKIEEKFAEAHLILSSLDEFGVNAIAAL